LILRAVEDTDLIARVRRGDVEAYNLLVSRWEKRVFNYLLRITGSPDDALDLSQDAFLKAYQNIGKLDDPARFGPWLYRIAHNEAYSTFRRRRPETALEDGDGGKVERRAAPGFSLDLSLAVTAALDRLTPEQREAVVLKVYEGFKFEEMAEVIGCPVSTVKSRLYTALDLLKTELSLPPTTPARVAGCELPPVKSRVDLRG
jgi:RNA polymerase sigma-70 factor (ECF subfamily)